MQSCEAAAGRAKDDCRAPASWHPSAALAFRNAASFAGHLPVAPEADTHVAVTIGAVTCD